MNSADDEFRTILENMMRFHLKNIARLVDLQNRGVSVGAPSVQDIIAQEQLAIDNLQGAIDLFNRLSR